MSSLITRAITSDGSARMIVAQTTEIVQKAADIHKTSKTMTAALGRSLTAASLMGSLLKDKDNSLTLQFKGDGPAGTIICVSDYSGNVRGYADFPDVELPPFVDADHRGSQDVAQPVGDQLRPAVAKTGDQGIGGSQIDSDEHSFRFLSCSSSNGSHRRGSPARRASFSDRPDAAPSLSRGFR